MLQRYQYQEMLDRLEYKDLGEVYQVVIERAIYDLRRYIPSNQPWFRDMIEDAPVGVYLINTVQPLTTFGPGAQSRMAFLRNGRPDLHNFKDYVSCRELTYSQEGRLILPRSPASMRDQLSETASYNPYEIKLMAARVVAYLDSLHRASQMVTNLQARELDAERYIRTESLTDYRNTEDHGINGLAKLLADIDAGFVRNDTYNLYTASLEGPLLKLSKGLDYRVVEYYRTEFEKVDAKRVFELGF